jgi:hypothetical protein
VTQPDIGLAELPRCSSFLPTVLSFGWTGGTRSDPVHGPPINALKKLPGLKPDPRALSDYLTSFLT